MDNDTQNATVERTSNNNATSGWDSKTLQPSQLKVEEKLYYHVKITDRTEITLKEAVGEIGILFPGYPPTVNPSQQRYPSTEDRTHYLALTNYNTTIWQPLLREDGMPLKIPILTPGPDTEIRSKASFNYSINSEERQISSELIRIDAKIVDRTSGRLEHSNLEFVEGLRLELTISSEFDAFSGDVFSDLETEKIAELLRSQIKKMTVEQEGSSSHVKNEAQDDKNNRSLIEKIRVGIQKNNKNSKETKSDQNLKQSRDVRQEYEKLLDDRERNLLRKREFLTGAFHLMQQYSPTGLSEITKYLNTVKLAYLGINTPYICRPSQTGIRCNTSENWLNVNANNSEKETSTAWNYNPERSAMEIREHLLCWNSDTKMYEMQVYLDLKPPSEDIQQITGSLVLCLDEPISGMKVGWSASKKGKVNYELTKYRTWLILDFEINFADIFRKRSYQLERRLHFEGVVFHPDHITNIRNILKNQGLVVIQVLDISPSSQADGENKQLVIKEVTAVKQGPELDVISLQIINQVSEGNHTIIYNKREERLTRSVSLGTLDIRLYARIMCQNDSQQKKSVNHLLNILQMNMEQLFTSSVARITKEEK